MDAPPPGSFQKLFSMDQLYVWLLLNTVPNQPLSHSAVVSVSERKGHEEVLDVEIWNYG